MRFSGLIQGHTASCRVEVESPGGRIPQLILTTTGQCILTKMFGCALPSDAGMQELDPDGRFMLY